MCCSAQSPNTRTRRDRQSTVRIHSNRLRSLVGRVCRDRARKFCQLALQAQPGAGNGEHELDAIKLPGWRGFLAVSSSAQGSGEHESTCVRAQRANLAPSQRGQQQRFRLLELLASRAEESPQIRVIAEFLDKQAKSVSLRWHGRQLLTRIAASCW